MNPSKIYSTEELVYFNEMWSQEDVEPGKHFKLKVKNELGIMTFVAISNEFIKGKAILDIVEIKKGAEADVIVVKNKEPSINK